MTDRELMQQALDALNSCCTQQTKMWFDNLLVYDAITALRERLAQPEQEPFEYWNAVEGWVKIDEVRQHFDSVGCGTIYKTAGEDRVPVYTIPPQRKPLTDKEILDAFCVSPGLHQFVQAFKAGVCFAEAAHGIKE